MLNQSGKMFFLKAHAHGSPQILQSTNLAFGIRDCFSDGLSHLIPMDTMH